jgi:hypothetical protein
MHFHFPFTTVEILWTLTFAAQLVLLVVLLGRDRMRRFPWFTAGIAILALRALTARVLFRRLSMVSFNSILLTLADLAFLVGLMVLVELARIAFRRAGRRAWIVSTVVILAVGGVVLWKWGAWPAWKSLTANPKLTSLVLMQLAAQKGQLLLGVLTVELGVAMVVFGRRFSAGWHTHTQRIVIGLSTAAMAELVISGIWEIIVRHVVPKSRDEYVRILGLRDKISNANSAVYLAVLIWWIACLWMNERGSASADSLPALKKHPIQPPTMDNPVSPGDQPV